jgi:hypothetical protein
MITERSIISMASLFCDSDGEEKVEEAIRDKGKFEGEYTKIVIGSIVMGGSRCEKCNRPLDKGDIGYYVANLSETIFDPRGESQFFDLEKAKITKY